MMRTQPKLSQSSSLRALGKLSLYASLIATGGHSLFGQDITFSNHIAPLLQKNCVECHNPDGIGPFSLVTYDQVKRRSRQIAEVLESRFMPPWKPDPDYGPMLQGERRLSDEQIELFSKWRSAGELPGNGPQRIEIPHDSQEWKLGSPDLVLEIPSGYILPADGNDIYRNFVIPIPLTGKRYVRAVEFKPMTQLVIHHAQITFDRSSWSREKDNADPGLGFDGMNIGNADNPTGYFIGWTPGQMPFESYPGAAWELSPGKDLVLRLHMLPSGKPVAVQPKIGFYFTDESPSHATAIVQLVESQIDIPAGDSNYVVEESMRLPVGVKLLGVYPHAHYLGKDMQIFARLPNGTDKGLLRIPDWDFNWQSDFRFAEPVYLPKDSDLVMRYSYDNSSENIRNPFSPPQRVSLGWSSFEEMGEVTVNLILEQPEDRLIVSEAERAYIRKSIGDAMYHYERGMEYLDVGMLEKAEEAFVESLNADPNFATAANNLGTTYQRMGMYERSREQYEQALQAEPESDLYILNLYSLLVNRFTSQEAYSHLKEAVDKYPEKERIRLQLADFLVENQQVYTALGVLKKGLSIDPNSPFLNFRMGVLYSQTNDPQNAAKHLNLVANTSGESPEERTAQADALFTLALLAVQQGDVTSFREFLERTFTRQYGHHGARFFAAGGALRQGDEATARQHLEVLIKLPEEQRPRTDEWISKLSFPSGQILVAKILSESGDSSAGRALLEVSLQQARNAGNANWAQEIEKALESH